MTSIFLWISLAGSWNISSGYTGYIDFGPVGYFGIGAYSTALCMILFHIPFGFSVIVGGVIASLISFFIGVPTLRLKGAYFAIATFAFSESMRQIVLSFDRTFNIEFFSGSHGLTLPMSNNFEMFYYIMLALATLVTAFNIFIEKTRLGLILKAIGESEKDAESIGINPSFFRLLVYSVTAFFISIAGGVYAYWVTYITPDDVFNLHKSVQMIIMTLIGGMGTLAGPIVGAIFLSTVSEFLGVEFIENYLIILGFVVIATILIEPSGFAGLKKWKKYFKSKI